MDYKLRIVAEKKDLDEKMDKLSTFIDSPTFARLDAFEQERLIS